ncbi:ATP-binding protein [Clostridium septicum]|nr:ATP-binding protein [Clostridium septicum]
MHPIAQNKLVDYLYKSSKELDVQVVFTTHSISLLRYISEKISIIKRV